jgi:hypothetical protein
MAVRTLVLSELFNLPEAERNARLDALASGTDAPLNGELAYLDARIAAYEARYEVSSERMVERFNRGEQPETADICAWLMLLKLRGSLIEPRR